MALLLLLFASSKTSQASMPEPSISHLSNGLKVASYAEEKVPLGEISLTFRWGTKDSPVGQSGLVQVLSEILSNSFSQNKEIDEFGAVRLSSMDEDSVTFGLRGLSEHLPKFADHLVRLIHGFESQVQREFSKAHALVLQRESLEPRYQFNYSDRVFFQLVSQGSPYENTTIPLISEIKTLTPEKLIAFGKTYLTPSRAIAVVSRAEGHSNWMSEVESKLEKWKSPANTSQPIAPVRIPKMGTPKGSRGVVISSGAFSGQSQVEIRFGMPLVYSTPKEYFHALITNSILGEQFMSRLSKKLRDQEGLVLTITTHLRVKKGVIVLGGATLSHPSVIQKVISKIISEIDLLRKDGVSISEFKQALEQISGSFVVKTSSYTDLASRWLSGEILGFSQAFSSGFVDAIQTVDLKQLNHWIALSVDSRKLVWVGTGKPAEMKNAFKASGISVTTL